MQQLAVAAVVDISHIALNRRIFAAIGWEQNRTSSFFFSRSGYKKDQTQASFNNWVSRSFKGIEYPAGLQDSSGQRLFQWKPSPSPETYTSDYIVLCDSSFKDRTIVRELKQQRGTKAVKESNSHLWILKHSWGFFFFLLTTINQLSLALPCDWLTLHLIFCMHLLKWAPLPTPGMPTRSILF